MIEVAGRMERSGLHILLAKLRKMGMLIVSFMFYV